MAKSKAKKKAPRPAKAAAKSAPRVQPIPKGYHTLTPGFCVRGAVEAIDFYKRAFGAKVRMRLTKPDGTTLAHAELMIGDSMFMLGEEDPAMAPSAQTLGGTPVNFYLYVANVDAGVERALAAGAKPIMPGGRSVSCSLLNQQALCLEKQFEVDHGFHRTPLVRGYLEALQYVSPSVARSAQCHLPNKPYSLCCAAQYYWRARADTQLRINWKVRHGDLTPRPLPKFHPRSNFVPPNLPCPRCKSEID